MLSAAVISACGGSSEAAPLPKKAFVREANAICAQSAEDREKAMAAANKEGGNAAGEEELAEFTDIVVETLRQQNEEIDGLGVPKGDQRAVQSFVDRSEEAVEAIEADPEKAFPGPTLTEANQAAEAYELYECVA